MSCSNLKDYQGEYRRIVTQFISLIIQVEEIWNGKWTSKIDKLKKQKENKQNE